MVRLDTITMHTNCQLSCCTGMNGQLWGLHQFKLRWLTSTTWSYWTQESFPLFRYTVPTFLIIRITSLSMKRIPLLQLLIIHRLKGIVIPTSYSYFLNCMNVILLMEDLPVVVLGGISFLLPVYGITDLEWYLLCIWSRIAKGKLYIFALVCRQPTHKRKSGLSIPVYETALQG